MSPESIWTCFESDKTEDELWSRLNRIANNSFGVTSILYGFTHNKYTAIRSGLTKSIYMRHNHPAAYVDALGESSFLDVDPCATPLFASPGAYLWDDVYASGQAGTKRREEVGRSFGMDVGVTLGLPFAGALGLTGAGLSAAGQRSAEFRKLWVEKHREITSLFAAFDARVRPTMTTRLFQLSPRERDVIAYAAAGLSGKEIAFRLGLSVKTVFNTMERARNALGAATSVEAIAKAYAFNLI